MQGRHQSSDRRRVGAWAVIVPLAVLACDCTRAQDDPIARRPDLDPMVLAADAIAIWEEGSTRWVRLSGRAAAFQGLDGVRAAEAVARIRPIDRSGRLSYRVDVFAEGEAGPVGRGPAVGRSTFDAGEVQIREPFAGGRVVPLGTPPAGDPLVARAMAALADVRPGAPERAPTPTPTVATMPGLPPTSPAPAERAPTPIPTVATMTPPIPTADDLPTIEAPPPLDDDVRAVTLFQIDPGPDQEGPSPAPRREAPAVEVPPPPPAPTVSSPFSGPAETQFQGIDPGVPDLPEPTLPEIPLLPEIEPDPDEPGESIPEIVPLPDEERMPRRPGEEFESGVLGTLPMAPGTQRRVNIYPLNPGISKFRRLARLDDGTEAYVANGGIQLVIDDDKYGLVDVSAKDVVIWTRSGRGGGLGMGSSTQSTDDPLEVYLEGDVEFRQDEREYAGGEDQKQLKAQRFYIDLKTERFYALNAELEQSAPGLVTPLRTMADSIAQYREPEPGPDGLPMLGLPRIRARNAVTTGSPFANPGYRIRSNTVNMFKLAPDDRRGGIRRRLLNPVGDGGGDVYLVDARSNTFFMGPAPFFYWPRFLTTTENLNPPLEQISFRTNNLFGQMILTNWDGFKLLGMRAPKWVDDWNIDIDYLSDRGFAAGSEFGYFGEDFSTDLLGRDLLPNVSSNYFGYFDLWGINDHGFDNLGTGPAIITNGPPGIVAFRNKVPPFQDFRGRILFRHMQSLLPDDADPLEDFRFQVEAAYYSDRHFLEQYFKRLHDSGLDQNTQFYAVRQWRTQAITGMASAMPMDWVTQSQYYPKLDYYWLGGAPFGLDRYFTYFQHTGADYANTHTASEVNNPGIFFGFLPYDPTSLTSGAFRTGRLYTNHELDLPLKLRALRVVPYVQGQLVGWDNQYANALPTIGYSPGLVAQDYIRGPQGSMVGRAWGAYGARADISFYRLFPGIESELLNVHGLMHKSTLFADYRNAFSTLPLRRIGVQDTLDDNTYEFVRRYFALNDYNTAVLPGQYNPLLLTLRRTVSPIAGTVDVQDRIETLRFGTSQRLQTKRGPIDDRRIIDWMELDLWTYYFPDATRDNFGVPFGQTQYRYEWHIGDRTSIVSTGWFDYFDIVGDPRYQSKPNNGISVITAGVNINRPPRGTMYLAYSIIDTGPINTSALNTSYGYWLSPKWYSTFGGVYDFGEGMLLSTTFSLTRVGADFLATVGLNYTPLQDNYSFVFELVPRFSPRTKIGGTSAVPYRPDLRFAPVQ